MILMICMEITRQPEPDQSTRRNGKEVKDIRYGWAFEIEDERSFTPINISFGPETQGLQDAERDTESLEHHSFLYS